MPLTEKKLKAEPLLLSLKHFYMKESLGQYIGVDLLKNLMTEFLELAAVISPELKLRHNRRVDRIFLKIIEGSNFTNVNCALLRLLKESLSSSSSSTPKMPTSLKCLRANIEKFPNYSDEICYDTILMELHDVANAPPIEQPNENELRTDFLKAVETIVQKLVNMKGHDILNHMKEISADSKLYRDVITVSLDNVPHSLSNKYNMYPIIHSKHLQDNMKENHYPV